MKMNFFKNTLRSKFLFVIFCVLAFSNFSIAGDGFKTNFSIDNWLFVILLLFIVIITYSIFKSVIDSLKEREHESQGSLKSRLKDKILEIKEEQSVFIYIALIFIALYFIYKFVQGTTWESHITEWLNLIVRWTHVVFGIAWIGASFYFNFLENSLNRTEGLRDEIAGNLWAVHGGGFYYLEKYKVAPKELPKHLHWFKYEAYFTWLSGFTLLVIVYYLDAKVYLIDKEVLDISSNLAIGIGMSSLAVGWLVYDFLCKSALAKKPMLFWFILFVFIASFAYFFLNVFNARAAYIHVGALIGTMMVGNVFSVIIPAQKAMVSAAKVGQMPNPQFGKNGLLRSRHNNYLTLPVIFIMISNHFPTTYGSNFNWIVLVGLSLCSVLVKHYLNKIEKGEKAVWIMPIAVIGMFSLTFLTAPRPVNVCIDDKIATFSEAQAVIEKRCIQCHSANPTDDVLTTAPNGVMFDTPELIKAYTDQILNRAVITKTMPQGNKTEMTQAERDVFIFKISSSEN
jgi:uncharacterized membrane protein